MSRMAVSAAVWLLAAGQLVGCSPSADDSLLASALEDAPQHEAQWSVTVPRELGDVRSAQVAGGYVVVLAESGVAVLDRREGTLVWHRERERPDGDGDFGVLLVDDRVVTVESGSAAGAGAGAAVLDLASGRAVATVPAGPGIPSVAVTQEAILSTDCADARRCTLTATDPQSGERLWQRAFPYVLSWEAPVDGPVPQSPPWFRRVDPMTAPRADTVVVRRATSDGGAVRVLSTSTGEDVDVRVGAGPDNRQLVPGDVYLRWKDSGRCGADVTAVPLTKGDGWRTTVGRWHLGDPSRPGRPAQCGRWTPTVVGTSLVTMTEDQRPRVYDVRTGVARWTGDTGFYPIGLAGDVMVLRADRGRGDVLAVDISRSEDLWRLPAALFPYDGFPHDGAVTGAGFAYRVPHDGRRVISFYALRTGELRWVCAGDNVLLGAGTDWIVTSSPGDRRQVSLFAG